MNIGIVMCLLFFFNYTATPELYTDRHTLSPHDACPILEQSLPGRTVAYMISEVRPQVGGIIQKRMFTEGEDVKAGQVLYQIDSASYQASYDNARATLAQAEAAVFSARPKAERYRELVAIDAVSKQDGDDAEAALQQYAAAVVAAKASLQIG